MAWPLSQDYNEAIQSPKQNFADPDLKRGEAATNALGLPIPYSGNFADVYQVRCPDGTRWAVKCFTREVPGLRERYAEISKHLRQAKLPFTVDFTYLEQGIRVAGAWHPALKMQWVEGLTLNQFVAQYLDKPAMLEALLQIWGKMASRLRLAEVGHCDLQHGNVLLVPGSGPNSLALKLIDYDGMWVPALAGKKTGELGHPCYQHPQRAKDGVYNLEVDRFPLLLIANALSAVKVKGKALWDKYDNGDNLLFKESDLRDPKQSGLFQELLRIADPATLALTAAMVRSLWADLAAAPLLEEAMPEQRPAAAIRTPPAPARKSAAVAAVPANDALAFDALPPGASASFTRKRATHKAGLPAWVIPAAIGGVLLLAVTVATAGGLAIWALTPRAKGPTAKPPDASVVQQGGETPQPPSPDDKEPPRPPKSDPAAQPPPVQAPQEKPGARVLFACGDRHQGPARTVCVSRDGKEGLSLGADKVIHRFNLQTGATLQNYSFEYEPRCAALTPDGGHALNAGGDGVVHLWDLKTATGPRQLAGHTGPVNWVDVSPDGKQALSCGDDGNIFLWDLVSYKKADGWQGSEKPISTVRFSPDGASCVWCGADGIAHFWDLAARREIYHIDSSALSPPRTPVTAVLLPGGLAEVGFAPFGCYHWDLQAKRMLNGFANNGPGACRAVAASSDGLLRAQADDAVTGLLLAGNPCHMTQKVAPECLAFAPDNRHVLAGCMDGTVQYCVVRLASDLEPPATVQTPGLPPGALSFETGWDKPVDPDADCTFALEKGGLTIAAPGKVHDLAAENNVMNAPRLLRDVTGDFTAQVQVAGDFHPSGDPGATNSRPFVGAGLVLMDGERTYLRLERAAVLAGGQVSAYVNFELRVDGTRAPVLSQNASPLASEGPVWLRLERKGDRLTASASQDGRQWAEWGTASAPMQAKPKIGVAAVTTSTMPFQPRFEDFRLTLAAAKPPPAPPPPPPVVKVEKRKPPADADLAKEIQGVKDDFKADFDKLAAPADRAALSTRLRVKAAALKDQPDRRYAMLIQARDLAAQGDDLPASMTIIDETADAFVIDARQAKAAALQAAGKTFSNRAAAKAYLDAVTPLLQDALAADDFDLVAPLLPAVRQAASDAGDQPASHAAGALVGRVQDLKAAFDAVQAAVQTLKDKPDDPAANLALGKYYCFQKQDWDKGAPLLAKGGDAALADAASKDAEPPASAEDKVAVADAWSKLAQPDAYAAMRPAMRRRAAFWYDKALPDLTDKEAEHKVRDRLAELTRDKDILHDFAAAWDDYDLAAVKVDVVGDNYLRLKPGQPLSLKKPLAGALEVTLIARCTKPQQTFALFQGPLQVVRWEVIDKSVSLHWRFRPTSGESSFDSPVVIAPDDWTTYTAVIRETTTLFTVNGQGSLSAGMKSDTSQPRALRVEAVGQVLEIKSLTVKPYAKP